MDDRGWQAVGWAVAAVVAVLEGKMSVDDLGPRLLARALKSEGDY